MLIEQFITSCRSSPKELVLDIDASNVPLYGSQERCVGAPVKTGSDL